ncbi:hypothetical protein C7B61_17940 [filamentous cyanobacterium CCP1]|nr:hypothetical protein C7B61_17940 [filamentous cyanobacterium CCP1]
MFSRNDIGFLPGLGQIAKKDTIQAPGKFFNPKGIKAIGSSVVMVGRSVRVYPNFAFTLRISHWQARCLHYGNHSIYIKVMFPSVLLW